MVKNQPDFTLKENPGYKMEIFLPETVKQESSDQERALRVCRACYAGFGTMGAAALSDPAGKGFYLLSRQLQKSLDK